MCLAMNLKSQNDLLFKTEGVPNLGANYKISTTSLNSVVVVFMRLVWRSNASCTAYK
jgi:hypothetical protein